MKTKFVTAIYSHLNGTKFGGRSNRYGHYRWSLLSLLKMTDSDFICYTSKEEYEDLKIFFYNKNGISEDKLKILVYDLSTHKFLDLFKSLGKYEKITNSDRCQEIQYMKFFWCLENIEGYDKLYWIDAGLSHCGLIPNKYLSNEGPDNRGYFESSLFNNNLLNNLNLFSENKFVLIGKENQRNYWSGTVNPKHFTNLDNSIHIIGGLFGGDSNLWENVVNIFEKYVNEISIEDQIIYHEEDLMKVMFRNHSELFKILEFDTWYHPDAPIPGLSDEHFIVNKSFYKILEELQ